MIERHFGALMDAAGQASKAAGTLWSWGERLATVLDRGGRLLTCGNGGSAAEAQHFSGEFAGRFRHDRKPYAAIPLHADTSALTANLNDYGHHDVFVRAVHAYGRPGDILVALSTSGESPNVVNAARAARDIGMTTWALTGPAPNRLAGVCHDAVTVETPNVATIQEIHLAAIHAICEVFDELTGSSPEPLGEV